MNKHSSESLYRIAMHSSALNCQTPEVLPQTLSFHGISDIKAETPGITLQPYPFFNVSDIEAVTPPFKASSSEALKAESDNDSDDDEPWENSGEEGKFERLMQLQRSKNNRKVLMKISGYTMFTPGFRSSGSHTRKYTKCWIRRLTKLRT